MISFPIHYKADRQKEQIVTKTADITIERVCAIVNAANSSLLGGGGVDGAIHRAAGSALIKACQNLRRSNYPDGLLAGNAVATTAGALPAKFIIHTVGPVYDHCRPHCKTVLENCYKNSLALALALGCDSIAFPSIATGAYGYPKEEAALIAFTAVKNFLDTNRGMEVRFIFHSFEDEALFRRTNGLL